MFNYQEIPNIEITDINRLVIDNGQIIRKIATNQKDISLGNYKPNKILKCDSQEFIKFLNSEVDNKKIIDSWDIWIEKGYLKLAYKINTFIVTSIIGVLVVFILVKGLNKIPPTSFFMLIFLLPQLIMYQKLMKNKTKN